MSLHDHKKDPVQGKNQDFLKIKLYIKADATGANIEMEGDAFFLAPQILTYCCTHLGVDSMDYANAMIKENRELFDGEDYEQNISVAISTMKFNRFGVEIEVAQEGNRNTFKAKGIKKEDVKTLMMIGLLLVHKDKRSDIMDIIHFSFEQDEVFLKKSVNERIEYISTAFYHAKLLIDEEGA
jgi:hypothetical protein